jgi:hypothetical protein
MMGVQIMGPWRRATALTVGVLISVTACASGSAETGKLGPRLPRMVPTDKPSVVVSPRSGQPAGSRRVTGKFFSMYVPANFQEKSVLASNGERLVAFDAPSSEPAAPVRVAVVPDPAAKKSAIESAYGLAVLKQAEGVRDLTRTKVKWPGAGSAILVQWTETRAGAVATERERTWQLVAQVNDHVTISLVAVAPEREFDAAGLAKIVETFRPHA